MNDTTKIVKDFYNDGVEKEWSRIEGRPEFLITCRFIDRYIKAGDKVLDIGGGPGRYSIYLAQKGCDVTLFDLSDENVKFAAQKAQQSGVALRTVAGDACNVDKIINEKFDHILLMGPMYHLLDEELRAKAVNASLNLLEVGGKIFVSFINLFAGIVYAMKLAPECMISTEECELPYRNAVLENTSFAGLAFTQAFFAKQDEILPFMSQFPLEKLHFFGQEGVMSVCEGNIMSKSKEIVDSWLDFCERTCEREELLSWSEHLMYIGEKVK